MVGRFVRLLLIAFLCYLPMAIGAWQQLEPDEVRTRSGPYFPRGRTADFTAGIKLVEIPAVVRDSHSRAVKGLRQQDFEIFDSGKRREIAAFSVQNDIQTVGPTANVSATSNTSNKSNARFVALVFDDENFGFDNITPDGLLRAIDAGVRFVQESLSPSDRAAVFSLSQGPVSPLTTDASKLIEAMRSLRIHRSIPPSTRLTGCQNAYSAYIAATRGGSMRAPTQTRVGPGGRPSASGSAALTQMQQGKALWEQVRMNSLRFFDMLGEVVDFMGQLPGQRFVLVASPGFQTGTLEAETARVIDRAVRAGVVFNTMDVTGLWGGPTAAECSPDSVTGSQMQQAAIDILSNLASGTGGQFFHNNNDLAQGFRDLGASEVSYLLGFVPHNGPDGRFHKVQVRVGPANHYAVQARPGYFAPWRDDGESGKKRKIDLAILNSDARNELSVDLAMTTDPEQKVPAVWAVVHVDVAKNQFRKVDGRRVQDLAIIAALFDPQGNFVAGKEGSISFALKESSFTALSKEGVNCTLRLLAPPGTYRLRTVVADAASGRMVAANGAVELR